MTNLFDALKDLKDFKNGPVKGGTLHGSLGGIRKKVIIPVPSDNNPTSRWNSLKFLLNLTWSGKASGAVSTGAFLSLLTFFAEQPSQMLKTLIDDPDLEAHIIDMSVNPELVPKFASRGLDMTVQETKYFEIARSGPSPGIDANPFARQETYDTEIRTTEELQKAISTVTIQIWILLTKAVTAPDTAKESEQKRWIKFVQQKRVDEFYKLKNDWLKFAREKISSDISVRRLMVTILITINKSSGTKSRLLQAISDIGNYISEAGMASFFLTIKYGIETKYPTLALNEFQGDLTTMMQLMKLYKEQGDIAPYLVILEESVQTKFAPGMYPILWSYAMGVGVALDKSMNNLNFNRTFLDANFFRLGQETVHRLEGNIDTKMAESLGLTEDQVSGLKELVKGETNKAVTSAPKGPVSGFTTFTGSEDFAETSVEEKPQTSQQYTPLQIMQPTVQNASSLDRKKFKDLTQSLAESLRSSKSQPASQTASSTSNVGSSSSQNKNSDLFVMDNM
ncbi:nucleocapsid protein [Jingmen Myotis davidii paramyxovirus 1]|uniref:Nucleocapsid n=1 Tax=Jingmen Myotis davidii paramyxovirus 1 TaxID=2928983 RepID=A0A8T9KQ91_9MONO|nr:nucleocapsid protein [Jingmen Myotis davidii paramyxovirus 1]